MLVFASALAASTDLEARVAALEARLTRDASAHRPEPRTPLFGSATGGTGTLTGTWTDHAAMIACPISGSVESVRTHELALAESEGGSGALRGTLCSSRALNSTYTLQWCEPVVGMLDPPVGDFWLTSKKPTAYQSDYPLVVSGRVVPVLLPPRLTLLSGKACPRPSSVCYSTSVLSGSAAYARTGDRDPFAVHLRHPPGHGCLSRHPAQDCRHAGAREHPNLHLLQMRRLPHLRLRVSRRVAYHAALVR